MADHVRLTAYHSFQAPNMMQDILARHLELPEHDVRVVCKDVGGSFGIKVHIYPDEMATCALSVMLGCPVKFTADRLESFVSDIHAREHRVPMAAEMPDIVVGHVETPTAYAGGGFKGVGEAGTAGAPGAVLNAVNDALAPLGARVAAQPITPEVVLKALGAL